MSSGILPAVPVFADPIILDNVSLGYGGKPVVESVSGIIARGSLLALVGPNGAGKSTLLKALAGLHHPLSGSICGSGTPRAAAYMAQQSAIDQAFPMRALNFVAMGLWRDIGPWKPLSRSHLDRAREALDQVGMADVADQRIGTLSGGQLRRALFARASLQDASLILLDEPFAGVDTATAQILLATIQAWHAHGRTIVAALHDLDQVRAQFPQTLLLARRVIAWGDTPDVLTAAKCDIAFGRHGHADV